MNAFILSKKKWFYQSYQATATSGLKVFVLLVFLLLLHALTTVAIVDS